jgi:MFS family permease
MALFLGAVAATFGCVLQAGAANLGMLIAGRIIAGISIGILTSTIPMYCSEIAPAQHRGALAGLLQWMLSWGFLVAQWLGYGCTFVDSHFQCTYTDDVITLQTWLIHVTGRFPLAFQCVPALILTVGALFLKESPRWLVDKDRFDEAKASLQALHGNGENDSYLAHEFEEIKHAIELERAAKLTSWKSLLANPVARKKLLVGCGAQFFCQTSGLNVVAYYGM